MRNAGNRFAGIMRYPTGEAPPPALGLKRFAFLCADGALPAAYGQRVERRRYERLFSSEVQFAKRRELFCRHYALSYEGSAAPGAPV